MKTLALDIGNVCVAIKPENFSLNLGTAVPREVLMIQYRSLEHGEIAPEEFFDRAASLIPGGFTPRRVEEAFRSIICDPMPGMRELVRSLKVRGWRAGFFSDISVPHLDEFRKRFPESELVSDGAFSFAAGDSKPSEAMFRYFEARFGVPDLYLDDRAELVEAARRRGWPAEVFPGAARVVLP